MLDDTGKRIAELRHKKDWTLEQLGEKVGVNKSTVRKWEIGMIKNMRRDKLVLLAKALNTTPEYLMGWTDNPEKEGKPANILPIPQSQKVPLLGTIACGEPIYAMEEHEEYFPLDQSIHADFCLRAQGDSMIGADIRSGDIVFCQDTPMVQNGQIAAVIIDDEATLKYFFKYGDMVVLRPANPNFEELVYEKDELNEIRILGRAVALQRRI